MGEIPFFLTCTQHKIEIEPVLNMRHTRMSIQEKFQDVKEWLEDKAEYQIWEARNEYNHDLDQLETKYQAFFRNAEIKGIHFNCNAIANITSMREKAEQKLSDALEVQVNSIREMAEKNIEAERQK